jgi:hypothetical protein
MEEEKGYYNEILAKFVVFHDKLGTHGCRVHGFPAQWDRDAFNALCDADKALFIERVEAFLQKMEECRIQKQRFAEEKKAQEEERQKHLNDLVASGITTKSLLARFSARFPEERTYIYRMVFGEARPPDEATWKFYVMWARVEENRDKNKKDYLEHVDKLQKALETFE